MPDAYDLVVIGSGAAAQTVSSRVREAGWSVAVIDHRPFGGTCMLRGCDPKKVLVAGEEAMDAARRMQGHGAAGDLRIDWPALMRFKRTFTDPVPARQAKEYAEQGIDAIQGTARFTAPDCVAVNGRILRARHIVLATGARPVPLGIPGEEHVVTSDAFLELNALPRRIALIGGGYIAAEFSHLAARAGAAVVILQRGGRLLPRFDPDAVGWLMGAFAALGIEVRTDATVRQVERTAAGFSVRYVARDGEQIVSADLVVHAAGRASDLAGLDLAAGDVAIKGAHLALNEFLQSVSNPARLRCRRRRRPWAAADAGRRPRRRCGRGKPAGGESASPRLSRYPQRSVHEFRRSPLPD